MLQCRDILSGRPLGSTTGAGLPRRRSAFIAAGLLATLVSTLRVYPHQLAYFNEASGGPAHGHRHLLHSNFDWGQNLLHVRDWIASDETRRPVFLAYQGEVLPAHIGINDTLPVPSIQNGEPLPSGWYLISQLYLSGGGSSVVDGGHAKYRLDSKTVDKLRQAQRVDTLGHSIAILHIP